MFSTVKLWIAGIAATFVAGLLARLKYKSSKLDAAEEIVKYQEAEIDLMHDDQEVSDKIREEHRIEEAYIEKKYRIQREAIQKLDDKPLADDLMQLLNEHNSKK